MFKLTGTDKSDVHRLIDNKYDYMDTELPMKMAPVAPISIVTSTHIAMNENSLAWRNRVLLPLFFLVSATCFVHLSDLYDFWSVLEEQRLEKVDGKKIRRGNQYYLESESVKDLTIYYRIDSTGRMSLTEIISYRYQTLGDSFFSSYLEVKYFEWAILLSYLFILPYLLYQLLTFSRRAPLFFDRERQIVFTWRNGKVWMQDYALIKVGSSAFSLWFFLYSLEPDGSLQERCYSLQPTGRLLFNGNAHHKQVLAAICQFMEKGMGRIWSEEWSEQRGKFLRPDHMPEDLYKQVSQIGKKLKVHNQT